MKKITIMILAVALTLNIASCSTVASMLAPTSTHVEAR